jgi:hypothetical protein
VERNRRDYRFDDTVDSGIRYPVPSRSALIALALALWIPFGVVAEIFKWVDGEGKVHYGDSPPQEQNAETIKPPPSPSDSAVLQSRSRLDALRDGEPAVQPDKVRGRQRQASDEKEEARKRRCHNAQTQLRVLEMGGPVFHVDDQGNRVYLEDAERATKLESAHKVVKADCR